MRDGLRKHQNGSEVTTFAIRALYHLPMIHGNNASLLHNPLKPVIATYELNYQKGRVISLGIYSDDVITPAKNERTLA